MSEPIVVIGMHRSGTTLVAEMLEQLGVFMGVLQDLNKEAVLFQWMNIALFSSAAASWYAPESLGQALENPARRAKLSSEIAPRLRGPRAVSYLGWPRMLHFWSIERQTGLWGWKDPRSTWTLPLWRHLFPDLRAVHVVRHGVDVAASLHEASIRRRAEAARRGGLPLRGFRWRDRRILRPVRRNWWVKRAAPPEPLEGRLELWARYVDHARAQVRDLGDRAIELRYEDLACDAKAVVRSLSRLCGIEPTSRQLSRASGLVDPSRSFAHKLTPELREFAERHSELLARYGY